MFTKEYFFQPLLELLFDLRSQDQARCNLANYKLNKIFQSEHSIDYFWYSHSKLLKLLTGHLGYSRWKDYLQIIVSLYDDVNLNKNDLPPSIKIEYGDRGAINWCRHLQERKNYYIKPSPMLADFVEIHRQASYSDVSIKNLFINHKLILMNLGRSLGQRDKIFFKNELSEHIFFKKYFFKLRFFNF